MKLINNQSGFNDVMFMTLIGGIIGAIFITGVFVWQEDQAYREYWSIINNQECPLPETECLSEEDWQSKAMMISSWDDYRLVNGTCSKEECLFVRDSSDYPLGFAKLEGYYTKYLDRAWGDEEYCDSLTVVSGTTEMVDSFLSLVNKGNTVHDKNDANQPIVNLDVSKLSDLERDLFFNSTANQPIEMIVWQSSPRGTGVGTCYPSFDIIEIR